jgi:hypothetical protein
MLDSAVAQYPIAIATYKTEHSRRDHEENQKNQSQKGYVNPSAGFLVWFKDSGSIKTFGTWLQNPSRLVVFFNHKD